MKFARTNLNNLSKSYQQKFGGLDLRVGATEGTFADMLNMSGKDFPVLAPRNLRKTYTDGLLNRPSTLVSPHGLCGGKGLAWVDGDTLFFNDQAVGGVTADAKSFAIINNWLCVFPDNKYYDTAGNNALTFDGGELEFTSNAIIHADPVFKDIAIGDEVIISGCTTEEDNNQRLVVSLVYDTFKQIEFDGLPFTPADPEAGEVTIRRFCNLGHEYVSGAGEITFHDGEYAGGFADANSITTTGLPFVGFNVGDAIHISGASSEKNNQLVPVIREISEDKKTLRFYSDVFDLENSATYAEKVIEEHSDSFAVAEFYVGSSKPNISAGTYTVNQTTKITLSSGGASTAVGKYYINKAATSGNQTGQKMYKIISADYADGRLTFETEIYYAAKVNTDAGVVTLERKVPSLDFVFENNNRLWGVDKDTNEIRCCALGNPKVWNNFEPLATACWAAPVGSHGAFTGGCSYGRKPVFHKEQEIIEVFGEKPSNFGYKQAARLGCASGSSKSIQVAGEAMIYLSREGFMAYTGGEPYPIGIVFGSVNMSGAVAGTTGRKYYVSLNDGGMDKSLYVYDTVYRLWHREDEFNAIDFAYTDDIYALRSDGEIIALDPLNADGTDEDELEWYAEFNDIADDSPNKKGLNKVQIRLKVPDGGSCVVKLSTNGGTYNTIKTISGSGAKQSYFAAFTVKRADYYRIKLEGTGAVEVNSIAIQRYMGSHI